MTPFEWKPDSLLYLLLMNTPPRPSTSLFGVFSPTMESPAQEPTLACPKHRTCNFPPVVSLRRSQGSRRHSSVTQSLCVYVTRRSAWRAIFPPRKAIIFQGLQGSCHIAVRSDRLASVTVYGEIQVVVFYDSTRYNVVGSPGTRFCVRARGYKPTDSG